MNIDKIRNAEDYVLANKHLMELLTYSQRVEQKIFEKILHKNIKDKKSCIYCMPNTLFGGRGFGKSYLVLKLASEYNLPVVVNIESRAEQLRQDSKRYGFSEVDVVTMRTIQFLRGHKEFTPSKVVLVDEPLRLEDAAILCEYGYIPIGFAINTNTLKSCSFIQHYEMRSHNQL